MRIKIFFSTILLMLSAGMLYAQTDPFVPCSGTDPDNACPLDTWVILLAFIAIVFAAWRLNNKRKTATAIPQSF